MKNLLRTRTNKSFCKLFHCITVSVIQLVRMRYLLHLCICAFVHMPYCLQVCTPRNVHPSS